MKSIILAILSLLFFLPVQAQKKTEEILSKKQMQEEIRLIKNALEEIHPALYAYLPKDSFELACEYLIENVPDSLTTKDFFKYLNPTIRSLRCGHIQLYHFFSLGKILKRILKSSYRQHLPYMFFYYNTDGAHGIKIVEKDTSQYGKLIGDLVSIDGKSPQELYDTLLPHLELDGYNKFAEHQLTYSFSKLYEYFLLDELKDSTEVIFVKENQKDTLWFGSEYIFSSLHDPNLSDEKWNWIAMEKQKKWYKEDYNLFYADTLAQTAKLKIRGFSVDKEGKLLTQIFQRIQADNIKNLILDLRGNLGGSMSSAARLLQYLAEEECAFYLDRKVGERPLLQGQKIIRKRIFKERMKKKLVKQFEIVSDYELVGETMNFSIQPRKKNHFDGNLYVLVDAQSFSAASFVSSFLKDQERGTIIGVETGGNAKWFSAIHTVALKQSYDKTKLFLTIPVYRINLDIETEKKDRGVQPDIEIEPTFEELYKGQDAALNEVLKIINKKDE